LGPWAAAIEQHHERWDGTGYPKGLAGTDIGLGARIVAVADAYEVMTSPRPYRRATSTRSAREELARGAAGTQFDPAVVRAFLTISLGRLRRIVGPVAWLFQIPLLASMSRLEVAASIVGRQFAAMAGSVAAVGVLAASGVIGTAPPASSAPQPVPSASGTIVERAVTLNGRTEVPPATSLPIAEPAVAITPSSTSQATPEDPDQSVLGDPERPDDANKRSPRTTWRRLPPVEVRLPPLPLPRPLPPVELPTVRIPGVDLPPTGTPIDDLLP
jgi:hypothetical protein